MTDPDAAALIQHEIERRVCKSQARGLYGSKTCAEAMTSPQLWCGECLSKSLLALLTARETALPPVETEWCERGQHDFVDPRDVAAALQLAQLAHQETRGSVAAWQQEHRRVVLALEWVESYYDGVLREAGCPCDRTTGVTCPLHNAELRAPSAYVGNPDPAKVTALEAALTVRETALQQLAVYWRSVSEKHRSNWGTTHADELEAVLGKLAPGSQGESVSPDSALAPLPGANEAKVTALEAALATARHSLWLNHGCAIAALYGDDGEMQCNNGMPFHQALDFKRDEFVELFHRALTAKGARAATDYANHIAKVEAERDALRDQVRQLAK